MKPDFIIVGAMKCATSTLHDQLSRQKGFFMSEPKEPNFFSDDENFALGLEWYRGLFSEAAGEQLKGESSTHYTKLPTNPKTIDRLKDECPDAKFIYMMRHPVERLVSHYIHDWTEKKISTDINQAVDDFSVLSDYGRYAYQIQPYLDNFGSAAVKPVFLRAMNANPQALLEIVCQFLGHREAVQWQADAEPQNVSSERLQRTPFVNFMLENQLISKIRQNFVPQALRDKVKSRYQMRERPVLDAAVETRLVEQFDRDLALLGEWLGLPLDCATFNERTTTLVDVDFSGYSG